jgi:5,10-methylenetetrahydromethanopterin reductase
MGEGDLAKAVELTSLDLAERMSFSGTPDEIVAKIRSEIQGTGVNHMICAVTDASLVKAFTGQQVDGVASVEEQLRLIHDEVMPAFT